MKTNKYKPYSTNLFHREITENDGVARFFKSEKRQKLF